MRTQTFALGSSLADVFVEFDIQYSAADLLRWTEDTTLLSGCWVAFVDSAGPTLHAGLDPSMGASLIWSFLDVSLMAQNAADAWHTVKLRYNQLASMNISTEDAVGSPSDQGSPVPTVDEIIIGMTAGVGSILFRNLKIGTTVGSSDLGASAGPTSYDSAVAPANDDIADALLLTGSSGTATCAEAFGATLEAGEPLSSNFPSPTRRSTWWKISPSVAAALSLSSEGSLQKRFLAADIEAIVGLSVFDGPDPSLASLVEAGSNMFGEDGLQDFAELEVPLKAGHTYFIQAVARDLYPGETYGYAYNVAWSTTSLTNDWFEAATVLSGNSGNVDDVIDADTLMQLGEPDFDPDFPADFPYRTRWFKFVPLATGLLTLETGDPTSGDPILDTIIELYRGNSISSLVLVDSNDDDGAGSYSKITQAYVTHGTTYHVRVHGFNKSTLGGFKLTWGLTTPNTRYRTSVSFELSMIGETFLTGKAATELDVKAAPELSTSNEIPIGATISGFEPFVP